jgi:serralysin
MKPPLESEPEIAFISGVASNATVAAISFGSWSGLTPATYDPINSFATKWGSTTLLPAGAPAGNVSFWFDSPASNWQPIEIDQWLSALALWSAVANITFTPAANAASANFILYRQPNQPNPNQGTYQQFPNSQTSTIGSNVEGAPGAGAFITIDPADTAPLNGSFATQGGDSYFALVHELGHLIGLGHGGPYNFNANPATQQFSAYDMQLWSIMSYIRPFEQNAFFFNQYPDEVKQTDWGISADGTPRWPTTPMMLDILAAQRLYGLPTSGPLIGGSHVFGFNTNVDVSIRRYFDFTVNQNPVITIWDGGLNNTLDLSGWSTPTRINLEPGSFSSANGQINNIAIASETVIETARGGGGGDQITGNSHGNFLFGNADNDTIEAAPATTGSTAAAAMTG